MIGTLDIGPSSSKNIPPKKRKLQYKQVYLTKWKETLKWVAPGLSEDCAYCKVCNKDFSVTHGGQLDLKQHAQYK